MNTLGLWIVLGVALHTMLSCDSTLCGTLASNRKCSCYKPRTLTCSSPGITSIPAMIQPVADTLQYMDLRGSCLITINAPELLKFPQLQLLDVRGQCLTPCVTLYNPHLISPYSKLSIRGLCKMVCIFHSFFIAKYNHKDHIIKH